MSETTLHLSIENSLNANNLLRIRKLIENADEDDLYYRWSDVLCQKCMQGLSSEEKSIFMKVLYLGH